VKNRSLVCLHRKCSALLNV
ncbi:pyridoxal-dependent decarboxylase, pyridoxal binding domain protein, partial [Vibrio parahaemolyticus VP-48]